MVRLRLAPAALLGMTVLAAAVIAPAAATPPDRVPARSSLSGCPAGSTPLLLTWGTGGTIRWPRNATSATAVDVGGSGLHVTLALNDPAQRNLDDSNPLTELGAGGVPGWAPLAYTETVGGGQLGYFRVGMNSLYRDEELRFTFEFSYPVLLADLTVADLDYAGLGAAADREPWASHQDRVRFTAARKGNPVGMSLHPLGGDRPLVAGDTAVGGPYQAGTDGDLRPADRRGMVRASTAEPVSTVVLGYANGPDDAAAEAGPDHPPPPPLPPDADSVSDSHTIRLRPIGLCVGVGSIGDTVFADSDGNGVQDPGEPGIPGVSLHLADPLGTVVATTTTDRDGRYTFDRLPAFRWTVLVDPFTVPPDVALSADPDGEPDARTTVDLGPGERMATADFGYRPASDSPR